MSACCVKNSVCAKRSSACWPRPNRPTRTRTSATWRNRQGDELPAELGRREERLKRIAEARKALEARAEAEQKQKASKPGKKDLPRRGGRGKGRSAVEPK